MKKKAKLDEDRKLYDQYGHQISHVDSFLLNNFSTVELVKLKLEFLAVLSSKKEFVSHNFDEITFIELQRFE